MLVKGEMDVKFKGARKNGGADVWRGREERKDSDDFDEGELPSGLGAPGTVLRSCMRRGDRADLALGRLIPLHSPKSDSMHGRSHTINNYCYGGVRQK
jgi:hypothetical protein